METTREERVWIQGGDGLISRVARDANLAEELLEALEKIATGRIVGEEEHSADSSRVKSSIAQNAIDKARGKVEGE